MLKTDSGIQILSANLQKTIQSIREIVGNHSDSEIYNALKETNMDPNETAQKLLNQDPFHEVRRRRDKKNENAGYNSYIEPRKRAEFVSQGSRFYGSDRSARRGGHTRTPIHDAGISREFRVVRDNRINQNSDRERKASPQVSSLAGDPRINNASEKSSSVSSYNQRHFGGRYVQTLDGVTDFRPKLARDRNFNMRKEHSVERQSAVTVSSSQVSTAKPSDSQSQSDGQASSSGVGVYAFASDPVHVPSPDSRSSAAIGAIRRDVGVVGGRQHPSESTSKQSFKQNISNLKSVLGSSSNTESFRPINSASGNDQSHSSVMGSVILSSPGTRLVNQFSGRSHQQPVGHHKGVLSSKEWKPKTSQKSNIPSPGVIGSPVKSASKPADDSENVDSEADHLEIKLSQLNIRESENVIIAQHIRVPDNDRCRLMFGSFGMESDDAENSGSQSAVPDSVEEELLEPSQSSEQISAVDDQFRNCGSSTPSSGAESESQLPDKNHSTGVSNTENYTDMGLESNSPFTASKLQQQQEDAELPNLSAYDPQPAYDMPYFRPSIDDAVRGPGLPSPREALASRSANGIPASSMAMMQQQVPIAQMYPQVHLSHLANVMPYRQFLPPVYVSPMVPGYSGNPGYHHLSNGSSYVLMPGSSHLSANSLKYGVQQFKPLPGSTPTGFGNFANPPGYAINAPGVVGGPTGANDSSRLKYKDSNLYVPNPQAETSEVWMHNHRELAGMQSTPYFNMQGQTAHPAYLQSPTGHASFNAAAAAQSSHLQFPGMYTPQPAAIPTAHHLGGSNIGVGVAPAPGAQVGAYQQPPQIGHLNWTTNF